MDENITYPVFIGNTSDGKIRLTFPAFDNMETEIEKSESIVTAAQEVIALQLKDLEDNGKPWPDPRDIVVKPDDQPGSTLVYVNVWMPYHRTLVRTIYVRKNLTIPAWLDELAKASNINFSEALTDALKERLGVGL